MSNIDIAICVIFTIFVLIAVWMWTTNREISNMKGVIRKKLQVMENETDSNIAHLTTKIKNLEGLLDRLERVAFRRMSLDCNGRKTETIPEKSYLKSESLDTIIAELMAKVQDELRTKQ